MAELTATTKSAVCLQSEISNLLATTLVPITLTLLLFLSFDIPAQLPAGNKFSISYDKRLEYRSRKNRGKTGDADRFPRIL